MSLDKTDISDIIILIQRFNSAIDNGFKASDKHIKTIENIKNEIWLWAIKDGPVPEGFNSRQEVFEMAVRTVDRFMN